MAQSFSCSSLSIKRQFSVLLPAAVILRICSGVSHRWRKRKFDPVRTIHLFVLQVLNGNTAIAHLSHLSLEAVNAAAFCKARMRLPLALFEQLLDFSATLCSTPRDALVKGIRRVLLVDATSSLLPDTRSVRTLFAQPRNIKPGCGYPMAKVLALVDAFSGCVLRPLISSLYVHEASHVWRLHPQLRKGDLLIGDRAFCSYVHLAMLSAKRGVYALFRMQQKQIVSFRAGRRHGNKGQPTSRFLCKLGPLDQIVQWFKPAQKPKWMSKAQYTQLPSSLLVRELRYRLASKGQRTRTVTIVTTLLDPDLYPPGEIARLYGIRWQIETHFNQLKTSMKMSQIKCKTAEGILKELLMHLIVYNLLRKVILDAAQRQKVEPKRISFIDALRYLANARAGEPMIALMLIPLRPGRHEPRVKKHLKYRYAPMTVKREIMLKKPYLYADKFK